MKLDKIARGLGFVVALLVATSVSAFATVDYQDEDNGNLTLVGASALPQSVHGILHLYKNVAEFENSNYGSGVDTGFFTGALVASSVVDGEINNRDFRVTAGIQAYESLKNSGYTPGGERAQALGASNSAMGWGLGRLWGAATCFGHGFIHCVINPITGTIGFLAGVASAAGSSAIIIGLVGAGAAGAIAAIGADLLVLLLLVCVLYSCIKFLRGLFNSPGGCGV